jgi:DNA-binding NtrC family response regulator
MARALPQMRAMAATLPASPSPTPSPSPGPRPVGFHGAVSDFKRRLIEATLTQAGGNRTRAARALGLQRTYLLRLMREFEVRIPPPPGPWRRSDNGGGANGAHAGNGGGPLAPTQSR